MEKEKSKLNFAVGFIYGLYFISIINELFMVGVQSFLINVNDYVFNFGFVLIILSIIQNKVNFENTNLNKILKDEYFILLNAIIIAHIIFFIGFFEYVLNLFSFVNEDLLIYLLSILFFTISLVVLLKAKKKRLMILTVVIFFLQILYQTIFFISFKNQMALYEESYYALAKNNIVAKECGKNFNCNRIDEKVLKDELLKDSKSIQDKKIREIVEHTIISFTNEVKESNKDIIVFSYGDNLSFKSKRYMPIYVYNKTNGLLITDYIANINLIQYHTILRKKLVGTSYLIWCLFSLFLVILHRSIRYNHEKK